MTPKKNLLHIITKLELGGAQQNTLYSVAHHDRSKYNVFLAAGTEGVLVEEAKKIKDAKMFLLPELKHPVSPLWDYRCYKKLKALMKAEKIDIVHTHSSKAGMLGRYAARAARVPVIIHTIHGFSFNDFQNKLKKNIFIALERAAAKFTDALIAVTSADIEKGLKYRVGEKEQYTVIHSSIDLDEFSRPYDTAKIRSEFGIKPEEKVAGMIACFKKQKDPVTFVRVAAEVVKAVPFSRFLMIGDGELRGSVEEEIKKNGLSGRVILTGWRKDVAALLSCFDVLVLTSLWEGLPRVFPQAMAAKKPIVATLVDGAKEALVDGVNGFVCAPKDIKGLAEKVIYLFKNPSEAVKMGGAGSKRAAGWDVNNMVPEIERVYEKVIKSKSL